VAAHQRINITLIDFTVSVGAQPGSNDPNTPSPSQHLLHLQQRQQLQQQHEHLQPSSSGGATTGGKQHTTECLLYAVIAEDASKEPLREASKEVPQNRNLNAAQAKGVVDRTRGGGGDETWNTTICGGRQRELTVYVSHSNKLRVHIAGHPQAFLLRYEGEIVA